MVATIRLDSSEYESGLDDASKKFQNAGKVLSSAGGTLTKGVTLPLVGAGTAVGKFSLDFEDSIAKVATIADTTVVPIDTLREQIVNLSNETGVSTSNIANSFYDVISATGDTENAMNLVDASTKLATAGFTDSGSALSVLTTALNAYGLEADQVTAISDSLVQTQNLGVTTVADLAANMGRAIATASAYGVNLGNVESAYISMTKGGISTAESTTYLSSMLKELGDSGSTVGKIIKEETGVSFGTLMQNGASLGDVLDILVQSVDGNSEAFINLWSSAEAGKASNAIVNQGLQEFDENLQAVTTSAGTTQTAYETMQTTSWELGQAINELKNGLVELGDALIPVLIPAFETLTEILEKALTWFGDLDEGTQEFIITIGIAAAAFGPILAALGNVVTTIGTILSVGGKLISGIGKLWGLLTANPFGAVIAVVAALVAGIIVLWNTNEDFRNAVGAIWEAIKGFFVDAWEAIKAAWQGAGEFFGGIVDGIKAVFDGIGEFLGGLFSDAWDIVKKAWDGAKEFFGDLWSNIKEKASDAAENIGEKLKTAWETIKTAWGNAKEFFGGIWDNIKEKGGDAAGKVKASFEKAWTGIKAAWGVANVFFSGVKDKIIDVFSGIGSKFKEIGGNIVDGIRDGISNAWNSFIDWLGSKVSGIVDAVKDMLGIHSPSTVFAGIGENMALGLAAGWDDQYSSIKRQIENGMTFEPATVGVRASSVYGGSYNGQGVQDWQTGRGGDTFNFYSPKALDPVSAAREMRKAKQQMALGYV